MPSVDVVFHFDFASPYSYIADCRIDEVLAGTSARITRAPVYLRGFETFKSGVPYASDKLSYMGRDLYAHVERFGIPFQFPERFPIDGLRALRAMVHLENASRESDASERARAHADSFRRAAFKAAWAENKNVADASVVLDIAESIGADRADVERGMASAEVKERLRKSTEESVARGAFGVPTFFVGEHMLWGQDRLDFLRWRVEQLERGNSAP